MKVIFTLVIIIFGVCALENAVAADDCVEVVPTRWHFLNEDGSMKESVKRGLLLAETADGTLYSTLDGYKLGKEICGSENFAYNYAENFFDDGNVPKYPCIFYEGHGNDQKAYTCKSGSCLQHVYLGCSPMDDGITPDSDCVEVVPTGWHFLNEDGSMKESVKRGLLLAETADGTLYSTLDGHKLGKEICGSVNFAYDDAENYFNDGNVPKYPCIFYEGYGNDQKAYTCKSSSCLRNDYLECFSPDNGNDWMLGMMQLLNNGPTTNEGLLLVVFFNPNQDWNRYYNFLYGTVCDNVNDRAADLACKYMEFDYAISYGSSPENTKYLEDGMDLEMIPRLIDNVNCAEDDSDIMECEARVLEKTNCDGSQAVWLKCGKYSEK